MQSNRLLESAATDLEAFSNLLVDLYRLAHRCSMRDFQRRVLERLRELIEFDSAWWGIVRSDRQLHGSYTFKLAAGFAEQWEQVKEFDNIADLVLDNPGLCVEIDFTAPGSGPDSMREMLMRFGISRVLCSTWLNASADLQIFLSLYRDGTEPRYSSRDLLYLKLLMPHLWEAWRANWNAQIEEIRVDSVVGRSGLAIADRHGTLHTAEPAFVNVLRAQWPNWTGPRLPIDVGHACRGALGIAAERICVRALEVGDLYLLEARRKSPIDSLTSRERSVAQGFSRGASYKQLASELHVSPATVRAHLRTIYEKLGVSDKAALATLMLAQCEILRAGTFDKMTSA